MGNPFVHMELNTGDLNKARAFYKKMFDWKLTDVPMGPGMVYTMFDAGKNPVGLSGGGMQKKPMPEAPTAWLAYVAVDDVNKAIAKARKLGAQIIVENQPVPGMGEFGIFLDPTGAALAVWKATAMPAAKKGSVKKGAKKGATKRGAKEGARKK